MSAPSLPFIGQLSPERAQQLRFLIGGGVNTLLGLAIFPVLLWAVPILRTYYMVGLLIGQVTCLVVAYFVQKVFVFRVKVGGLRQFLTFSSFYLAIYAANWVALPLMVEGFGLMPEVVQVAFVLVTVIGSYFWHRTVTFRQRRPGAPLHRNAVPAQNTADKDVS